MSTTPIQFPVRYAESVDRTPRNEATMVLTPTQDGIYFECGCQHGKLRIEDFETLAKQIPAAVKAAREATTPAQPYLTIKWADGREDPGPYGQVDIIEDTDEVEFTFVDGSPKAGQKKRYPAVDIAYPLAEVIPHEAGK